MVKKLVIQIPCFNEAASLPVTLAALPKAVAGYDKVEVLVIDDGSSDDTAEVARMAGVDRVYRHPYNKGLAAAYVSGLEQALDMGAHTIVNTDADNQYDAGDIATITGPICDGSAFVVIGERNLEAIAHFSDIKKKIHYFGNRIIRFVSGLPVSDATSGFRALHCDIAAQVNIYSKYTYTIEMLIMLGSNRIPVVFRPVRVNPELRPSRLIRSNWQYVRKSMSIILRSLFIYRPMFMWVSVAIAFAAIALSFGVCAASHPRPWAWGGALTFTLCSVLAVFMGLVCDAVRTVRVLAEKARIQKLSAR